MHSKMTVGVNTHQKFHFSMKYARDWFVLLHKQPLIETTYNLL